MLRILIEVESADRYRTDDTVVVAGLDVLPEQRRAVSDETALRTCVAEKRNASMINLYSLIHRVGQK